MELDWKFRWRHERQNWEQVRRRSVQVEYIEQNRIAVVKFTMDKRSGYYVMGVLSDVTKYSRPYYIISAQNPQLVTNNEAEKL